MEFSRDSKALEINANAKFGKKDRSIFEENETTISVSWTGGGQDLKQRKWQIPYKNYQTNNRVQPSKIGHLKPCVPQP